MISALLAEDKRLSAIDFENFVPSERALFSRSHKKVGNNIECYYCQKVGHTALYCNMGQPSGQGISGAILMPHVRRKE